MKVILRLVVGLITLGTTGCGAALSMRVGVSSSRNEVREGKPESHKIENARLRMTVESVAPFGGVLVVGDLCEVTRDDVVTTLSITKYSWAPKSVNPNTAVTMEALTAALVGTASLYAIFSSKPELRAGVPYGFGAAGMLFGLALVDNWIVNALESDSVDARDNVRHNRAEVPCTSARPVANRVGTVSINGATHHFMTDTGGHFTLDTAIYTKAYVEIENVGALWVEPTRVAAQ